MDLVIMKINVIALNDRNAFDRAVYQEDILIELSERLALEMEYAQINSEQLQSLLGKNEAYVTGLLEGFANIKLKELADIFSVFNKYVKLMPTYEGQKVCYLDNSSKLETVTLYVNSTSKIKIDEDFKKLSVMTYSDNNNQKLKELVDIKFALNNNSVNYSEFQESLGLKKQFSKSLVESQPQSKDDFFINSSSLSNVK